MNIKSNIIFSDSSNDFITKVQIDFPQSQEEEVVMTTKKSN